MKYARLSFILTIAAYLSVIIVSLMKLEHRPIYGSLGFVPSLLMLAFAFIFYMISVAKEKRTDKTMWVLFGIIFPGIANIVYYIKSK
jgi:uncharacterized BrkB/YihY/UPF0761 family membrane protein